jgi:glycosyltransferase involved in cell wall biosynthesis
LKLLFVHERFGALAGAEANLHLTAAELQRRGHGIALLHGPGTGKGEAVWGETFDRRFAISPGIPSTSAAEAVGAFEPDAVYVHQMSDLEVIEALLDSAVPLVRMVHDHDLYCMRSYKYHYFSRGICARAASPFCLFPCGAFIARNHDGGFPFKWVSYVAKKKEIQLNRRFHKIVVNSRYMRDELLRNGFADEKIALHVPVPRNDSAAWRSSFSDRNRVLYVGQIVRGKGVDVLLQSLARVRVRFECVILGDGNHRSFCEELSRRLGLSERVHFKGYVPPAELEDYYRESSVVAVSSVWPEPFGMVGIEAMRYGLPVVAFDAGGIKEWLIDGQNGFLVPWMDRTQYAGRLERLLRDKTLARQMGERGRELAAQYYDFDRYIDGLEDLFARVTAQPECEVAA